jgi:hypothetical protein
VVVTVSARGYTRVDCERCGKEFTASGGTETLCAKCQLETNTAWQRLGAWQTIAALLMEANDLVDEQDLFSLIWKVDYIKGQLRNEEWLESVGYRIERGERFSEKLVKIEE